MMRWISIHPRGLFKGVSVETPQYVIYWAWPKYLYSIFIAYTQNDFSPFHLLLFRCWTELLLGRPQVVLQPGEGQ